MTRCFLSGKPFVLSLIAILTVICFAQAEEQKKSNVLADPFFQPQTLKDLGEQSAQGTVALYFSWTQAFPGGKISCEGVNPKYPLLAEEPDPTISVGWLQKQSLCPDPNTPCYKFFDYPVTPNGSFCTSNTFVCTAKAGCDTCIGIIPTIIKTTGTPKFSECPEVAVKNISISSGIAKQEVETASIQWIDFNADGRLDFFITGSKSGNASATGTNANQTTALFKNIGRGKFVDVTKKVKITNDGRDARGSSWADFNNDGFPDVFIANTEGEPTLLLNNRGVFRDISNELSIPSLKGVAAIGNRAGIWFDANNDKLIDLFVIKEGAPNQLFKQKSPAEFENIAKSAGLEFEGPGRSAVAADFNKDGFQDLYLANFKKANKLYLNNGNETFKDVAGVAKVGFIGASVQVNAVDYDRDRDIDIFVVNNEGASFLFKNLTPKTAGPGEVAALKFKKITPGALRAAKKGIAAAFSDYDLDADDDLILAQSGGEDNLVFKNNGKGIFSRLQGIDLSNPDNPTGVAVGDFNNDGLPDIAIGDGDSSQDRGDSLFENEGGASNNFLTLILQGTVSNRSAIGATVLVQTGLIFQQKTVTAGNGTTQESLPVEFGLGTATAIDSVRIVWPSGISQTLSNVKINQNLKVVEPQQ